MNEDIIETIGPIEQPDGSVLVGKVIYDPDGADFIDNPSQDHSGENAWEWIEFDSGVERNEWIAQQAYVYDDPDEYADPILSDQSPRVREWFRPGLDFWIERYEHGLVCYAPTGESSQVDRQWGVAPGVAILRFKEGHGCGDPNDPDGVLNFVRGVCSEYTDWCNGAIYGYVIERWPTIAHYETDPDKGENIDSLWGTIGWDDQHNCTYAETELRSALDSYTREEVST